MNDNTKEVRCSKCKKHFNIPLSNIKNIDDNLVHLNEKYRCLHCNKSSNLYCDPNIDIKKVFAERAAKVKEEERRKAAEPISCPQCKSQQFNVTHGFSVGNAVLGNLAFGDIGSIAGVGTGKIKFTCLKCGHTWKLKKS